MTKKFLLIPNEMKDRDLIFTARLIAFLQEQGQQVCITADKMKYLARPIEAYDGGQADAAVVIGGDGTILRWAHIFVPRQIPVLGVNFGRLGYLAEVEPAAAQDALLQVIRGDCQVEHRMILDGELRTADGTVRRMTALNDFVIHRGEMSGTLAVRAFINGTCMDTFAGDGIIAATPNGSTAYNFSAGGPIITPAAENILFTPICSHSAAARSIVATGSDSFRFETDVTGEDTFPILSADGMEKIPLRGACSLTVKKSEDCFSLLHVSKMSFYDLLHKKLFR